MWKLSINPMPEDAKYAKQELPSWSHTMSDLNLDQLSPDHFTNVHAYTPHVYRDQYDAIDPTSSALSQKGKTIIITGASSGIGANGWAPAFAKAGAKTIILVGRNEKRLQKTAVDISKLGPDSDIVSHVAEISDAESVEKLFQMVGKKYGKPDVLVNNAGTFASQGKIGDADPTKWWSDFEANVKAAFLMTRAFIRLVDGAKATVITMSTDQATQVFASVSSYGISKLAALRLSEFVAEEYPNINAVTIQPGVVMSPMIIGKLSVRTSSMY